MPFGGRFGTRSALLGSGWRSLVAVVAIGFVLTLGGWFRLTSDVRAEGIRLLADDGEVLAANLENDVKSAIQEVLGLRGLFEASDKVTGEEFARFSELVGLSPSSALVFALRESSSRGASWPLQYVVSRDGIGPALGDDISEDSELREAITRAVRRGTPTVSGFFRVEGDDKPVVAVLQTVGTDGPEFGIVAAVLQLDQRIQDAADGVLSPGQSWSVAALAEGGANVSTPYEWTRSVELGGQQFVMSVSSDHLLGGGSRRPLAVLLFGTVVTALAALVVHISQRRRRTDREIDWLRRSSADKDRFLAGVGHEIRTPLTVVVGMLDLIVDRAGQLTADERADLIASARISARDIAWIVDDFVAAGRMSADALTVRSQPIELDPLVAKLISSAGFDPRLSVRFASGLGSCLGDGLRITQILLNLLDNALRNARLVIEIGGYHDERFVTIEVRNDGSQIPNELIDGLFEPFVAVRPEGQPQPLGLGLSVSRALARRMGGDLGYEWRDKNVVFRLTLPAVPADETSSPLSPRRRRGEGTAR